MCKKNNNNNNKCTCRVTWEFSERLHMYSRLFMIDSSWNVMAHDDARERNWRGNWRIEWVASTLHTTSEHSVSSITTADAHTSVYSSRLNWRPRRFKWIRPFRPKTKSGFCTCAITFQLTTTTEKDKSTCNTVGPPCGRSEPSNLDLLPPPRPPSRRHWKF